MKTIRSQASSPLIVVFLAALSACGGGGGASSGFPIVTTPPAATMPDTPVPATTATRVKVIDGALANALVFLDLNDNDMLDAGEPSGRTDATGLATLEIPNEQLGKGPMVALVGTDATDADSGPVSVPFTLRAPPDSTAVLSPLTTAVHTLVRDTGGSTAEAESAVKSQSGLSVSLLADYTADTSTEGRAAATLARLVVVAMQQQSQALAAAVGTRDLSGAVVSAQDLDRAVSQRVVRMLPDLAQAASTPAVLGACATPGSAACGAELQAQAQQANAAGGLTPGALAVVLGTARSPDSSLAGGTPPEAGASLVLMNFGDVDNWYYRVFVSNAQESTPDADGLVRYRGIYRSNTGGVLREWAARSSYDRRDDTHWNGSAWVVCALGQQSVQSARDADGRVANNNYCDGLNLSNSQRNALDISGRAMADIAAAIRASLPDYATWGDPPEGYAGAGRPDYGAAVFPTGSKLYSDVSLRTGAALAYIESSPIIRYSAPIAAGGDAQLASASACLSAEASRNPTIQTQTLEEMIAIFRGTPCIFGQLNINSTASPTPLLSPVPNEWWSNSTLSIGTLGSAAVVSNPTTYATGNTLIRVGFGNGNAVTYYSCLQRQVNGSSRNCTPVGTGTYTIAAVGDARVLSFNDAPALAAPLDYERIFVERGSKVFFGYRSKLAATSTTRLNLAATNALFGQIGIPLVTP